MQYITPVQEQVQLLAGYSVAAEGFNELRRQVERRLPDLHRDRVYTAEELVGKDYWAELCRGDQRMAGRCIAYMVARRLLPLTFVDGKHEYPKKYQLK
jgi:hypothetical protein